MLTVVLVVVLVLLAVLYAAVPLLVSRQVDPLPNERDPVLQDLEEDREALFRAIRELDDRDDVLAERRDQLRARYEAKAAGVLRAIDERRAHLEGRPRPAARPTTRGVPWAPLGLLGAMAASALALGPFVLPRVGQDATVTTFFADDLRRAEALRDLQRAAERDPGVPTYMTLADAYWQLEDAAQAEVTYRRVLLEAEGDSGAGAPALAYRRLAMLSVGQDLDLARDYLVEARRADPTDAETLFGLGEVAFATSAFALSEEAFEAYLATPEGAGDAEAERRLDLVQRLGPAIASLERERTRDTLAGIAEILWQEGDVDQSVEIYFEILTQHDPLDVVSLSRTGQMLFLRGRMDDAIGLLERAAEVAGGAERLEPQASLFLGNAYFSEGADAEAIDAWEAHISAVGPDAGGRVPDLIASARTRLRGEEIDPEVLRGAAVGEVPDKAPDVEPGATASERAVAALDDPSALQVLGEELYARQCASCHGVEGGGGMGPRLAGNARAAQAANVRSAITFGRGMMPGFGAVLESEEIDVLVLWLANEMASPR
ncbi:hypothetical protein BH23DEI1_BH23DEI1_01340 [soil metagenome]